MSQPSPSRDTPKRRRWLWVTATAVVALLTGVFLILRPTSGTTPANGTTCRLVPPATQPPGMDSSGVRTVTKGYSRVGAKVSMGAILTNESDKTAYRTLVTFDALDFAGRTVVHRDHQLFRTQAVPVFLPGESLAVGLSSLLDEVTRAGRKQISSIAVTVQVGQWLANGDGMNGLGRVSATLDPGSGERQPDGSGSLRFDVESANCAMDDDKGTTMTSRGVSTVFRDASGTVVGGSLDNTPQLDACRPGKHSGLRFAVIQTDIPATADLDQTWITAYCDFERPIGRPTSGAPYN
jgi:hypothetical protein